MKNVSVIGIGRLGLCFALSLEKAGYNVVGTDISEEYVDLINSRTLKSPEPSVEAYLKKSKNLRASTSNEDAVTHSDIIFVVVATPSLPDGTYNHSQVEMLVSELKKIGAQTEKKHLVICCTTMPKYCDSIQERLSSLNYTVSYNPEFIAQGSIISDQANPDMVLIGSETERDGKSLCEIYEKMVENKPKYHVMSRTEAEITKIALNCFLTMKISFANMVGDSAIASSCDPDKILSAIGADSRIGKKYLGYGFGYGGPCFPRDNRAYSIFADSVGSHSLMSLAADETNKKHFHFQVNQFKKNNPHKGSIKMPFITYKPETDIIEESQQLLYAVSLASSGYRVILSENEGVTKRIKEIYGDLFEYEENTNGH